MDNQRVFQVKVSDNVFDCVRVVLATTDLNKAYELFQLLNKSRAHEFVSISEVK